MNDVNTGSLTRMPGVTMAGGGTRDYGRVSFVSAGVDPIYFADEATRRAIVERLRRAQAGQPGPDRRTRVQFLPGPVGYEGSIRVVVTSRE